MRTYLSAMRGRLMDLNSRKNMLIVGVLGTIAGAGVAGVAGADSVDSGFTTIGTSLIGYLGDAVVLILLVLGLGLGIRMLIKWAKAAVRAT